MLFNNLNDITSGLTSRGGLIKAAVIVVGVIVAANVFNIVKRKVFA